MGSSRNSDWEKKSSWYQHLKTYKKGLGERICFLSSSLFWFLYVKQRALRPARLIYSVSAVFTVRRWGYSLMLQKRAVEVRGIVKAAFKRYIKKRKFCIEKHILRSFQSSYSYIFQGRHFTDFLEFMHERASRKMRHFCKLIYRYLFLIILVYKWYCVDKWSIGVSAYRLAVIIRIRFA